MALAFLFQDDSVMFIDAVTNYSKSYSSSVSNHPIDKSAVVTDHVSKDNPNFSFKGIISSADFHNTYTRPAELLQENISSEYNTPTEGAVINKESSYLDMLPGSVQQFLSSGNNTTVEVDEFRGSPHQVARDRMRQAWKDSEVITLLDYDYDISTGRSLAVRRFEDCLIKHLTDNESVDTGDAYEFTITLEQVRFAYVKEADVKVTSESVSDTAEKKTNEGDQGDGSNANDAETQERKNTYQTYFKAKLESVISPSMLEKAASIVFGGG